MVFQEFFKQSVLISISLLYFHVACGVCVNPNPSIHSEVTEKEVYAPLSGVEISLLQAKAQKAECK